MGSSESSPVPKHLGGRIDYKILLIIFCLTVTYHVVNNAIKDITPEFNAIDVIELSLQSVVMISAFIISKLYWPGKYWKSVLCVGHSIWNVAYCRGHVADL